MNWSPFLLSFQLALMTSLLLLLIGVPIAAALAYRRFWGRPLVEAIISLPLVLPPTVLGFYLLMWLGPHSYLGEFFDTELGLSLVFSFEGLLIGSLVYSLPFTIQPLVSGFRQVPTSTREVAYTLGKSRWETLRRVVLPQMKSALLSAVVLTFAHTLGEFGVVLMLGGNIPGETRVASIAIYHAVESMDYSTAHLYALGLLGVCFLLLSLVYASQRRGGGLWAR